MLRIDLQNQLDVVSYQRLLDMCKVDTDPLHATSVRWRRVLRSPQEFPGAGRRLLLARATYRTASTRPHRTDRCSSCSTWRCVRTSNKGLCRTQQVRFFCVCVCVCVCLGVRPTSHHRTLQFADWRVGWTPEQVWSHTVHARACVCSSVDSWELRGLSCLANAMVCTS